jgi:hypothetical protein
MKEKEELLLLFTLNLPIHHNRKLKMCFTPVEISMFFILCSPSYILDNILSSQKCTLPQPLRRYKFTQGKTYIQTTILVNNIS